MIWVTNYKFKEFGSLEKILLSNLGITKSAFFYTSFLFHDYSGNEGEMQVEDGKVESKVQHKKDKNISNGNNSADMKEDFQINITTSENISSMNQNNFISSDSLQRFQQWKPGLCHKECWINDEVSSKFKANK